MNALMNIASFACPTYYAAKAWQALTFKAPSEWNKFKSSFTPQFQQYAQQQGVRNDFNLFVMYSDSDNLASTVGTNFNPHSDIVLILAPYFKELPLPAVKWLIQDDMRRPRPLGRG